MFTLLTRRAAAIASLAIAVCALPPRTFAQPHPELGLPLMRNYSPKDFGGEGQVWSVLQDRRGVMLFGVGGGVLEYDGVSWRRIDIAAAVARSLAMDATGRVWVGAEADFGYLAANAKGEEHFISLLDKIPAEHRAFSDVWQVLHTAKGSFFRSYKRLFRWDGQRMQVWVSNTRFEALAEVYGRIYTSQLGTGLQEITGDELRPVPGGEAYKDSFKLFLHPYDGQRILISARAQALTLFDGKTVTPFAPQLNEYFQKNELYTSSILPDGSIAVTTLRGGALILTHDGRLRRLIDQSSGLQSLGVTAAYVDRSGSLWLALTNGITRVEINSQVSLHILPSGRNSISDIVRHEGKLYAAAASGGLALSRLTPGAGMAPPVMKPLQISTTQAFSMLSFRDPDNGPPQLLIASSNGVKRLQGDAAVPAISGVEGVQHSASFLEPSRHDPRLIYVGYRDGVGAIRWKNGKWVDDGRLPGVSDQIRIIQEESAEIVWVATSAGGVLRVQIPATGIRDGRAQRFSEGAGFGTGDARVLYTGGELFASAGHNTRLSRYDRAAGKFVADNRFPPPIDDPTASGEFFPLPNGDVWAAYANFTTVRQGLFRKQPDGSYRFDENTFRELTPFRTATARTDPDGVMWISGSEGLIRFDTRIRPPQPILRYARAPRYRQRPGGTVQRIAHPERRRAGTPRRPQWFAL